MKQTQMNIVKGIVKAGRAIRTEHVKIAAMNLGISCADRYLRWLKADGEIVSYKRPKDKTLTWCMNQDS